MVLPGRTSPQELIDAADHALVGTRGAVMSAFHLDRVTGALEHACVGNLRVLVDQPGSGVQLACQMGTLGTRQRRRPVRVE